MNREHAIKPGLLVLLGPSGVGKSTLTDRLVNNAEYIKERISVAEVTKYKEKPQRESHDNPDYREHVDIISAKRREQLEEDGTIGEFRYPHFRWTYYVDNYVFEAVKNSLVPMPLNLQGWEKARELGKDGKLGDITSIFLHLPPEDARARFRARDLLDEEELEKTIHRFNDDMLRYATLIYEYDMAFGNDSPMIIPGEVSSERFLQGSKYKAIERTLRRIERGLRLGIKKGNHERYIGWVLNKTLGVSLDQIKDSVAEKKVALTLDTEEMIGAYLAKLPHRIVLPQQEIEELRESLPSAIVGLTARYGTLGVYLNHGKKYDSATKLRLINFFEELAGVPQSVFKDIAFSLRSVYGLSCSDTKLDDVISFSLRDHPFVRDQPSAPLDRVSFVVADTARSRVAEVTPLDSEGMEGLLRGVYQRQTTSVRDIGQPRPAYAAPYAPAK